MKYKSRNQKAFTLLEIVIVIVIIWILMAATMRFGGGRVSFLNNKNIKEQFVSNYDSIYADNMMSSYYLGELYETLNIDFVSWNSWFVYSYKDHSGDDISEGASLIEDGNYIINNLKLWWTDVANLNFVLKPYVLGCEINEEVDVDANIEIIVNHDKSYCFEISSDSCRIEKISCD